MPVVRFMEIVAPIFWVVAVIVLWLTYWRGRSVLRKRAALRTLLVGVSLFAAGAVLGFIAITSV